jgi:FkbM family methyltransferase
MYPCHHGRGGSKDAMDRTLITRWLPTAFKQRLRPLIAPVAYAMERPRMRAFYGAIIEPGDLVFDIGAAEGFHAATLVDLGARVVCVEPQPYCLGVLERRLGDHPRITIVPKGVSDEPGEATLHVSRGDPEISTFGVEKWRSGRFSGYSWEDRVVVPVVTLDQLIEEHGVPTLAKIDVEGYEPQVLNGLGQPLPWVSFEFTREYLDDTRRCVERLASLAPTAFNATLFRRWHPMLDEWVDGEELLDRLAESGEETLYGDIHARPADTHQEAASPSKSPS